MTREEMTIHEALSELKTLDSRINRTVSQGVFVTTNKHSDSKINGYDLNTYIDMMKSSYQKVMDLINRRKAIKRAVVLSNAITKVTVNGIEYTVAEAIEMKNHGVDLEMNFANVMMDQLSDARSKILRENAKLEDRATTYVTGLYGSKDTNVSADKISSAKKEFIEQNTIDLIDPNNSQDAIYNINDAAGTFLSKVDSALSVSNALTKIVVEY